MQNFDPHVVMQKLDALALAYGDLERRVSSLEGHSVVAGVGATQISKVEIPAEELGQYSGDVKKNGPVLIDEGNGYFSHYCAGCKQMHSFRTIGTEMEPKPLWQFNGNMERPTFTPSMRWHGDQCHYVLTDGIMNYQPDCAHELKGTKVPLQAIPDNLLPGVDDANEASE